MHWGSFSAAAASWSSGEKDTFWDLLLNACHFRQTIVKSLSDVTRDHIKLECAKKASVEDDGDKSVEQMGI